MLLELFDCRLEPTAPVCMAAWSRTRHTHTPPVILPAHPSRFVTPSLAARNHTSLDRTIRINAPDRARKKKIPGTPPTTTHPTRKWKQKYGPQDLRVRTAQPGPEPIQPPNHLYLKTRQFGSGRIGPLDITNPEGGAAGKCN